MTNEQAREVFEAAITATNDPNKKDIIRLGMEFFTNEEFRKKLSDYVFEKTKDNE